MPSQDELRDHQGSPTRSSEAIETSRNRCAPTIRILSHAASSARAIHVPSIIRLSLRLPLVVPLFPPAQGAFDLHKVPREVNLKRNDRRPLLRDLFPPLSKLVGMGEQLPLPGGLMVVNVATAVLRDVHADEPKLVTPQAAVGLADRALALPQPLNLSSNEGDPKLKLVENLILIEGPAVF